MGTALGFLLLSEALGGSASAADAGTWLLEIEAGAAWQTRNDIQIPSDTGTPFALDEIVGSGPYAAPRFEATWRFAERHGLRLVVAPFEVDDDGVLPAATDFAGETFAAGTPTRFVYQFDSYRLTYHYCFHDGSRWTWRVGGTAKIRDARVELSQSGVSAADANTGLVPLAHLAGEWRFAPRWRLELVLDALAAPQGRAEDLSVKIRRNVSESWSVAFGYRTLEGGADNDEVDTFTWINYAVVSAACRF